MLFRSIVDIFDSFSENNTGYIIMEYLEGKTVKEILKSDGTFTFERAKEIVLAVLAPLKEVHKEGIIHRDIAPDNIFITDDGTIKLIDFGASRYATTLHSKSLSVLLKPGYAPEEQYRSRGQQGPWTDMYALAVTFYKMLTGITPEEALERRVKDAVKEPSKLGAVLPQSAENAIMNAMNVNIEERTQSAEAFEQALTADEVTRIKGTRLNQDTGRIPLWMKISAAVLAVAILTTSILVATGVINLRGGFLDLGGKYVTAEGYVTVPEVLKKTVTEAQSITEDKGLLFQITDKRYDDTGLIPKDRVLLQDPTAGRDVLIGSILGVVVSGGKPEVIQKGIMPDVTYKNIAEAKAMLDEAGITYTINYEESDTVAKDVVMRQSVEAGTPTDSAVITVSSGRKVDSSNTQPQVASQSNSHSPESSPTSQPSSSQQVSASDFEYTLNGNSITITRYKGNSKNVVIPSVIEGRSVTAISCTGPDGTFWSGWDNVTSVTIPNSVTIIGERAFYGCELTSVTIPNSVTSIGDYAFVLSGKLTLINIPNSVTSIGQNAFNNCPNLTSITIPNSVTSIGQNAFAVSGLTSITIPSSVTSLGNSSFFGCNSLISAYFEGNAPGSEFAIFSNVHHSFKIYYHSGATGWTLPTWNGYPTAIW